MSGFGSPPPQRGAAAGQPGFDGSGEFDFAAGKARGYRWWTVPGYQTACPCCYPTGPVIPPLEFTHIEGATGYAWPPGIIQAQCNRWLHHQPPVERDYVGDCGCGFWAYWDFQVYNLGGLPVAGVIEGTGRTLIGELGFRCQRARIVALHVPFDNILRIYLSALPAKDNSGTLRIGSVVLRRGAVDTFYALGGSKPVPRREDSERSAGTAEALASLRAAQIEARLMKLYPEAEVFATLPAMLLKYPPLGRP